MKYFALLTKLGENLLAQATALGTKIELTHMAVGDGGGSLPTPDTNQTKLIKEQRRAAINTLSIDEQNKNQIVAEQIIPEKDGGWWIREIGLFDKDGNLIAVANCPETYKPQLVEGSGRTQSIRMVLIVSHTESVTLKIDPSVVLATRDYVDDSVKKGIEEHEKGRKHPDASTTAKGLVQLADTLSTDNTKAVTPKLATEINQRATNAQTTADTANTNATNANNNANGRVPNTRKVNNKPLSTDINLTAGDVSAYDKSESDNRFQPKGNYAPAGNYQPAGDYATNAALNNGLNSKLNTSLTYSISSSDSVFWKGSHAFKTEIGIGDLGMQGKRMWISLSGISLNPTGSAFYSVYWPTKAGTLLTSSDITSVSGTSSSLVMSQNSVTNELAKKFDKTSIVHDVGSSTTDVISQGAVTNLLFGVAQGYFDVTDQRAVDTTYTNTTGRPIVVSISTIKTMESSNSLIAAVNDIRVFDQVIGGGNSLTKNIVASFIVPRNGKYRVSASVAIDKWVELR
ncbi:phage tail protein [Providencia manganoxydans]|uniref:phage tail protein n=1 Tax=Providencia manganoxydans TaxID=2923283 RepID=UPI0034E5A8D6